VSLIKLRMGPSLRNSPAIMERVAACPVCSSHTHSASDCTALTGDLKEGFYSPPSGYQGGGDDEDDSLADIKEIPYIGNKCLRGKLLASIATCLFPSAPYHRPVLM
jgi:hypothetical protein